MKVQKIIAFTIAGLLLLTIGFAGGTLWAGYQTSAGQETVSQEPAPAAPLGLAASPTTEVPGTDVEGLPRYPGSSRVEYRQVLDGELMETEVEYVVADELQVVHDFYRNVFEEEGWTVADLGVYQGEWTFFVIQGRREALMEIESRGALIEIEIEINEPLNTFVESTRES